MTVRVACAQFAPKKADVPANLDMIAESIDAASGAGADIVCFAETCTTGYFLEGGVLECALTPGQLAEEVGNRTSKLSKPIDSLVGFYELHDDKVYNSVAHMEFSDGQWRTNFVYRKFFLATYGVFDEDRFVGRGREPGVFNSRFGKLGVLICEDVWHSIMPTLQALMGAQMVFVPSASPARGFSGESIGNLERYQRMLRSFTEEHGVFAVNCQLIGFEGGKGFVGGSSIVDPFGKTIAASPIQEDHLLIADCDLDLIQIARQNTPLLADLESHWEDLRRQVDGI